MIHLEDYWDDETPGPDREPSNELRNEVEETITQMELLKVSELKDICRSVSFPVSGRKAILQDLIRNFLQNAIVVGKSDPYRVQAVKFLIERIRKNEPLPVYKDLWNALRKGTPVSAITVRSMDGTSTAQQQSSAVIRQSPTHRRTTSSTASTSRAPPANPQVTPSASSPVPTIHFKESPFYKIQRLIPELVMKVEITGGRGMCSAKFKLCKADYDLLTSPDSKYKLYLFSGMINPVGSRGNEPIQFPFPNELRFNNIQIKDNIRGFKSKPGTAKPADLTPHLKPYTQQNNIELIYAFTTREYKLFGYIVEMITPEQLLEKVLQNPKIIKQATLLYLKKTFKEDEEMGLTTTSTIMSLQCPISYTRMKYPSKSINCKHLQCFDGLWFLHSQLQIPTWQCPVCQIDIALENLAISEFVDDILRSCEDNVEQVELTSDGKWTAILEDDDEDDSDGDGGDRNDTNSKKDTSVSNHPSVSSHSNEPIVISLDSDDEEINTRVNNNSNDNNQDYDDDDQLIADIASNHAESGNTNTPADKSSASVTSKTLDPKTYKPNALETTTPTTNRVVPEYAESSSNYVGRQLPNILGKTPLNASGVGNSLHLISPNVSLSSPTPRNATTNTNSSTFSTPPVLRMSSLDPGGSRAASQATIRPSMSTTYPVTSTTNRLNQPEESLVYSSREQYRDMPLLPDIPPTFSNARPNANQFASSSVCGATVFPNSMLNQRTNSVPMADLNTRNDVRQISMPILPTLPPNISTRANSNKLAPPLIANNSIISRSSPPIGASAPLQRSKPIVNPFIPRRPYVTVLPQKRQLSNASATSNGPIMGTWKTQDYEKKSSNG
ncbi:SUMO ligase siz1 [Saccharomyces pastorianus]|uniref:E3 SUMO-protein transferase SIZ2 n=1 Tax=Saccharomyces pastorianus TaxID=27292 RepID=A0A6C1E349_SACPS|nr:SUMO ligase siz1 [Saccharomyces pastorianus]